MPTQHHQHSTAKSSQIKIKIKIKIQNPKSNPSVFIGSDGERERVTRCRLYSSQTRYHHHHLRPKCQTPNTIQTRTQTPPKRHPNLMQMPETHNLHASTTDFLIKPPRRCLHSVEEERVGRRESRKKEREGRERKEREKNERGERNESIK